MTMTGLSPAPVAQTSGEANPPPTPLEMQNISSETTGILGETDSLQEPRKPTGHMPPGPARMDTTTALAQATSILEPPIEAESTVSPVSAAPAALVNRERAYSSAIGPSTDSPSIPLKDPEITGPVLLITLLLTNGARHPYRLDSGYLKKRSANVHNDDPYNLSVYKLKELILRDWRDDWEQKPSSPGAIRLISFGKLLEDKSALRGEWHTTDLVPKTRRTRALTGHCRIEIQPRRCQRRTHDDQAARPGRRRRRKGRQIVQGAPRRRHGKDTRLSMHRHVDNNHLTPWNVDANVNVNVD